ncbi:hypothetical protein SDC9_85863 [bioreactor metagenome]|uniref:Uncharacterized protein n=1 Tax=bioreactor metagenome TaxID=1076179 RepID=A0A644ZED2_9ZZZZ
MGVRGAVGVSQRGEKCPAKAAGGNRLILKKPQKLSLVHPQQVQNLRQVPRASRPQTGGHGGPCASRQRTEQVGGDAAAAFRHPLKKGLKVGVIPQGEGAGLLSGGVLLAAVGVRPVDAARVGDVLNAGIIDRVGNGTVGGGWFPRGDGIGDVHNFRHRFSSVSLLQKFHKFATNFKAIR